MLHHQRLLTQVQARCQAAKAPALLSQIAEAGRPANMYDANAQRVPNGAQNYTRDACTNGYATSAVEGAPAAPSAHLITIGLSS